MVGRYFERRKVEIRMASEALGMGKGTILKSGGRR